VVSSCEEAYSIINADTALHEYGPSFQLIQVRTLTTKIANILAMRYKHTMPLSVASPLTYPV
jgi:hypothetical protein